jgi:hypothetical protein
MLLCPVAKSLNKWGWSERKYGDVELIMAEAPEIRARKEKEKKFIERKGRRPQRQRTNHKAMNPKRMR